MITGVDRCLVIDVWEGQLDIDEAVLKANGVAGISIRLNDMGGGHHMDTAFVKQWEEAKGFVRFPYFVYNPWVNGAENFRWLNDNMPIDAKSVAIDIEVKYSAVSPAEYAGEVEKFLQLVEKKWKFIIYTAEWFLPYLSKWRNADYWWAQYPDPNKYFGDITTWNQLKTRLDSPNLEQPFNVSKIPGTLKLWQFSGDFLTLEGCKRDIDINLFYGSEDELREYFGVSEAIPNPEPEPTPEPEPVSPIGKVTVQVFTLNVRKDPNTFSEIVGRKYMLQSVDIYDILVGDDVWALTDDGFIALRYQGTYFTSWRPTPASVVAWVKPRPLPYNGPAVVAGSDAPRQNHPHYPMDEQWQNWIKSLSDNREDCWALFSAEDVGPSKGFNDQGKLIYIPATWSFNVVETTGLVKDGWVEVKCINMNKGIPNYTHESHPTFVGIMTTSTQDGNIMGFAPKGTLPSPWNSTRDPLMSYADTMWLPQEFLLTNCVILTRSLNVRAGAGIENPLVGSYVYGNVVTVHEIKHVGKNIWARSDKGWFALRYNDAFYTNWKVV